ncbi:MAG: LysM peptidoglycan-binding domain-containing protein [Chitinophagaceae bacterium]
MMKTKWLLIGLMLLTMQVAMAQSGDLQVQGTSPNLYLVHTVQAKENWYSVGRIYNISPKQLAPYNTLSLDKPLSVGQTLRVPLVAENFSQDGQKSADEVFVPVHHTIQEKEWFYRISVNYNKVPVETLEKWNNINKDQAKAGLNIIVGYLKVKTGQSALAAHGQSKIVAAAPSVTIGNVPDVKKADVKDEKKPADNIDATAKNNTPNNIPKTENKPVVAPAVDNTVATNNNATPVANKVVTGGGKSYFKTQYEESGKSISGNAGIFKSTSGWGDGKFYALVNNVPVGTIVQVNNPVSGRAVFAKVLGNLPDMKESTGLVARLSDAAAAELNAAGGRFSVELRY